MRTRILGLALLALSAAAGKNYTVTLFDPTMVAGQKLAPGDYQLEVTGNKAVLKNGKHTVESPVKVVDAERKFSSTTVRYGSENGGNQIQEIRIGGTKMRVLFEEPGAGAGGANGR